jgi:hypothetical protein
MLHPRAGFLVGARRSPGDAARAPQKGENQLLGQLFSERRQPQSASRGNRWRFGELSWFCHIHDACHLLAGE